MHDACHPIYEGFDHVRIVDKWARIWIGGVDQGSRNVRAISLKPGEEDPVVSTCFFHLSIQGFA